MVGCHQHEYSIRRPRSRCALADFEREHNKPLRGRQEHFRGKMHLKEHIYNSGPHPCLALPLNAMSKDVDSEIAKTSRGSLGAAPDAIPCHHPVDDDKL